MEALKFSTQEHFSIKHIHPLFGGLVGLLGITG
jgi:hypothetical protein